MLGCPLAVTLDTPSQRSGLAVRWTDTGSDTWTVLLEFQIQMPAEAHVGTTGLGTGGVKQNTWGY